MTTIAYHFHKPTAEQAFAALGPVETVFRASGAEYVLAAKERVPLGSPTVLAGHSAGCQAVREHLRRQGNDQVRGLVLTDGVHTQLAALDAPPGSPVFESGLGVWRQVFKQATTPNGYPVFWTSSRIDPGSYASTRATLQKLCDEFTSLGKLPAAGVVSWGKMRFYLTSGTDADEHNKHQSKLAAVGGAFVADGTEPMFAELGGWEPTRPEPEPLPAPGKTSGRGGFGNWLLALVGIGTLANEARRNRGR